MGRRPEHRLKRGKGILKEPRDKEQYDHLPELVEKARSGDQDAFEQLYTDYERYFRAEAQKYLSVRADMDDVLQNAWIQVYRHLDQLRDPKLFPAWGRSVVRNECIMFIRGRERNAGKDELVDLTESEDYLSTGDRTAAEYRREFNPEAWMEEQETRRLLQDILSKLSDEHRETLILWSEGAEYKEIAEQQDISIGTVKSRIHYAKKRIAEYVRSLEKGGLHMFGMAPVPFFLWLMEQVDKAALLPAGEHIRPFFGAGGILASGTVPGAGDPAAASAAAAQNSAAAAPGHAGTVGSAGRAAVSGASAAAGAATASGTMAAGAATASGTMAAGTAGTAAAETAAAGTAAGTSAAAGTFSAAGTVTAAGSTTASGAAAVGLAAGTAAAGSAIGTAAGAAAFLSHKAAAVIAAVMIGTGGIAGGGALVHQKTVLKQEAQAAADSVKDSSGTQERELTGQADHPKPAQDAKQTETAGKQKTSVQVAAGNEQKETTAAAAVTDTADSSNSVQVTVGNEQKETTAAAAVTVTADSSKDQGAGAVREDLASAEQAHTHVWTAQNKTIHHEAVTESRPVTKTVTVVDHPAWEEKISEEIGKIYTCGTCGQAFGSFGAVTVHHMDTGHNGCIHTSTTETHVIRHPAITHTEEKTCYETVIVKPAYDETVQIIVCSVCGQTK